MKLEAIVLRLIKSYPKISFSIEFDWWAHSSRSNSKNYGFFSYFLGMALIMTSSNWLVISVEDSNFFIIFSLFDLYISKNGLISKQKPSIMAKEERFSGVIIPLYTILWVRRASMILFRLLDHRDKISVKKSLSNSPYKAIKGWSWKASLALCCNIFSRIRCRHLKMSNFGLGWLDDSIAWVIDFLEDMISSLELP